MIAKKFISTDKKVKSLDSREKSRLIIFLRAVPLFLDTVRYN